MEYRVEVELGNGMYRRATYYYRCPRCGYRVQDLVVVMRRSDGKLVIESEERVAVAARA
jgi:DNA-directed RNA polymerase subunit RPC12/RpoP